MLSALSVAARRQVNLAADTWYAELSRVCLAAVITPNCCGQGLCCIWWRLYMYGDFMVVDGQWYTANYVGHSGFSSCTIRNGDYYVCTARSLIKDST